MGYTEVPMNPTSKGCFTMREYERWRASRRIYVPNRNGTPLSSDWLLNWARSR